MSKIFLIGIGTGNPDHVTLEAIEALNNADLILIPDKGPSKTGLADLRELILQRVLTKKTPVSQFAMPKRDGSGDYLSGVEKWHDAIAACWQDAIMRENNPAKVAVMVWGDPSLYDSSLRIVSRLGFECKVVAGITAIQALCAAHAIPLNGLGNGFVVTTARQLRANGWPQGFDTVVVMLDSGGAFEAISPENTHIWWGAYLGMPEQILASGPLGETREKILRMRAEARQKHGWIMDIYLLRRHRA